MALTIGPHNPKDTVENHLHTAICGDKTTLAAAQRAIATDWTTAERKLGIDRPCPLSPERREGGFALGT